MTQFTLDLRAGYATDVPLLVPIAVELLESAEALGQPGITANDVRTIAEARGILLASKQQRYIGNVTRKALIAAGLSTVGRAKTPRVKKRGGNDVALWGRKRAA